MQASKASRVCLPHPPRIVHHQSMRLRVRARRRMRTRKLRSPRRRSGDAAEKEDANAAVAAGSAGEGPSGHAPTITLGQTTDQVTAAIGQPRGIVDLGGEVELQATGYEDHLSEREGQ